MLRLLIAALLAYAAFGLLRRMTARLSGGRNSSKSAAAPGEMIACAHCGTFVLRAEAIESKGRCYCSAGCKEAG